jgi:hypothetical protein
MAMATNAFIGKGTKPGNAELKAALGPAKPIWDRLLTGLDEQFGVRDYEWKCYSPKSGWSLRVKRNSRTIVWLGPSDGYFTVLFILGKEAMQAARKAKLSKAMREVLDEAPMYPEGAAVRVRVNSSRSLGTVKKLAAIKLAS